MKQILEQPLIFLTNKNELEKRFDPKFYTPKFISVIKKLKHLRTIKLKKISEIYSGATPLAKGSAYISKELGIPFIRSGNLTEDNKIDYDNILYLKPEIHNKMLRRSKLQKNDILIAIVGATIGKVSLFNDDCEANVNQAIALVRLKEGSINPFYTLYFLRSKYGQIQLKRIQRPVARANINLEEIGEIEIPILSLSIQNQIIKIMQNAYEKKKENLRKAEKLFNDIDNFVLEELGIKLLEIEEKNIFILNKSKLEQRFDVEFYKQEYLAILHSLAENEKRGKYKLIKFKEIADYFKKGVEVGSEVYTNEGILFIRVENIQNYSLVITDNSKFINKELYYRLVNFKPQIGEIVLTKDGTIGRAVLIENEINGITSGGILRIKLKKNVDPYYICGLLNSKFIRTIFGRYTIGAVIKHLLPERIKEMLLPIPSLQIQNEIAKEIKQRKKEAERLVQEANEILDKTKEEVENLIEIDTRDNRLLDEILPERRITTGDFILFYDHSIMRLGYDFPQTMILILKLLKEVGIAVFANWLYDKIKNRSERLRINNKEVNIDKKEIERELFKATKQER